MNHQNNKFTVVSSFRQSFLKQFYIQFYGTYQHKMLIQLSSPSRLYCYVLTATTPTHSPTTTANKNEKKKNRQQQQLSIDFPPKQLNIFSEFTSCRQRVCIIIQCCCKKRISFTFELIVFTRFYLLYL